MRNLLRKGCHKIKKKEVLLSVRYKEDDQYQTKLPSIRYYKNHAEKVSLVKFFLYEAELPLILIF